MVGIGVGDIWNQSPEVLILESLEGQIYGLAVYLSQFVVCSLESPCHDGTDSNTFPISGVKLGYGLVSFPQVLQQLYELQVLMPCH